MGSRGLGTRDFISQRKRVIFLSALADLKDSAVPKSAWRCTIMSIGWRHFLSIRWSMSSQQKRWGSEVAIDEQTGLTTIRLGLISVPCPPTLKSGRWASKTHCTHIDLMCLPRRAPRTRASSSFFLNDFLTKRIDNAVAFPALRKPDIYLGH